MAGAVRCELPERTVSGQTDEDSKINFLMIIFLTQFSARRRSLPVPIRGRILAASGVRGRGAVAVERLAIAPRRPKPYGPGAPGVASRGYWRRSPLAEPMLRRRASGPQAVVRPP